MPIFRRLLIITFIAFLGTLSNAQTDSLNLLKTDTISISKEQLRHQEIKLRNGLVIPISLTFKSDNVVSQIPYDFDSEKAKISFKNNSLKPGDLVYFNYRLYEEAMRDTLSRSFKNGIDNQVAYIALDIPKNASNTPLLPEGLQYSGSFGRGLTAGTVSYTHLRAHETKANLVCRLLLEKKK